MNLPSLAERITSKVNRERLLQTAIDLVAVPSRTGEARQVLDRLAEILEQDDFSVERPTGGYDTAPAVAVRWTPGEIGKTIQFNGHLDTVHLPFVPPKVEGDLLKGSGSSDMKAGTAAAVEALRALRDAEVLDRGSILLTAHDLHETPWGDGRQLNGLIEAGYVGDAVLIPEYLNHCLPVIGRGGLTWKVKILRPGQPIHEVMRPNEPNVIEAGASLVGRLLQLDGELARKQHPLAGRESLFIGQIHSGEIFNQYPRECRLEGTRRWLPGTKRTEVERELRTLVNDLQRDTGVSADLDINLMRDAFVLPEDHTFVGLFREMFQLTSDGKTLPIGAKPFCDDGNSFWDLAHVPAITHGPNAGGAHTLNEWVSIDDLMRVARLYALTAARFCA